MGFPTFDMLSINQIRILCKTWGLKHYSGQKIQI
nr:MAG TPA: hyhpotheticla protein [Caudoviricetes sp.]